VSSSYPYVRLIACARALRPCARAAEPGRRGFLARVPLASGLLSGAYDENTAFIRRLADWAGIEKPVATSLDGHANPALVARLQQLDDGYLLFLINHNRAAQDVAGAGGAPPRAHPPAPPAPPPAATTHPR
jgi:hypothetical protein